MHIPDYFKNKIYNTFGAQGEKWLDSIESQVHLWTRKWNLEIVGLVDNLSYNYVLKAMQEDDTPVILKLGVPNSEFRNEVYALQVYNGEGSAQLLKADPVRGAMLLEHIVPGTMLSEEKDDHTAIMQYIEVWEAIRRPLPEKAAFPSILEWAKGLSGYKAKYNGNDSPISMKHIDLASQFFHDIAESASGMELLHGDLHHENILYSKLHGWVAIDPKGVAGDPYFDLASFMINHLHTKNNPQAVLEKRVEIIQQELGLDYDRFLKACIAMSILSASWSVQEKDENWIQTYQSAQWFDELRS
ncbi:aminoglycoside phosphotransferase family protein [Peribacillus sp. SCS-155]|uniref:aminoglycoside phosphotransferase family protein n=1 Tax=Peribacillus sedimenti TaxID=3115297 RepID=UPI003906A7E8